MMRHRLKLRVAEVTSVRRVCCAHGLDCQDEFGLAPLQDQVGQAGFEQRDRDALLHGKPPAWLPPWLRRREAPGSLPDPCPDRCERLLSGEHESETEHVARGCAPFRYFALTFETPFAVDQSGEVCELPFLEFHYYALYREGVMPDE